MEEALEELHGSDDCDNRNIPIEERRVLKIYRALIQKIAER